MKECFCGCGRRAPRFRLGVRSVNRRGVQVVERLTEVERRGGRDYPELAEWFKQGEGIVATLAGVVHGEMARRSVDKQAVREWQEQGHAIAPSTRRVQAMLGRAARQSGLCSEDAVAAVARGMREHGLTAEQAIEAVARGELR